MHSHIVVGAPAFITAVLIAVLTVAQPYAVA